MGTIEQVACLFLIDRMGSQLPLPHRDRGYPRPCRPRRAQGGPSLGMGRVGYRHAGRDKHCVSQKPAGPSPDKDGRGYGRCRAWFLGSTFVSTRQVPAVHDRGRAAATAAPVWRFVRPLFQPAAVVAAVGFMVSALTLGQAWRSQNSRPCRVTVPSAGHVLGRFSGGGGGPVASLRRHRCGGDGLGADRCRGCWLHRCGFSALPGSQLNPRPPLQSRWRPRRACSRPPSATPDEPTYGQICPNAPRCRPTAGRLLMPESPDGTSVRPKAVLICYCCGPGEGVERRVQVGAGCSAGVGCADVILR